MKIKEILAAVLCVMKRKTAPAVISMVTSALAFTSPAYTELEYIQGTGSTGKQWIHTGFTPACTDRIELKVRFTTVSESQTLFCSRGTNKTTDCTFTGFLQSNGRLRIDCGISAGPSSTRSPVADEDYVIVADGTTRAVSCNGENQPALTYDTSVTAFGDFTPASAMTLFASHTLGPDLSESSATSQFANFGKHRFYYLRVYDAAGALKADFRPARDDDAAEGSAARYGVYDRVARAFRPNRGAAAFTAGPPLVGEGGALVVANDATIPVPSSATVPAAGTTSCAAGESVSCSAAPFDDPSGAIRATPVGYTLETLDRSTGEWSDPVAYAGTSYTHGQTGAAATRLTWRWSTGRAPAVLAPIENGLQYRLDASDISSLTTNEDGQVTEWRANAGALAIAFTNATKYCPYYNANAFGDGLPGVVFGLCKDGKTKQYASYQYTSDLISNLATTNQTVMMVLKMSVQGSSMSYYWGPDRGSALIGATGSKYGVYCTDFVTDSIYFNGVFQWKMPDPYTTITYKNYTFNAPTWLCAVSASARGFALTGLGNSKRNFANSSEGPRSMYGPISEVLVWDRKLTDAERQYMDEYIRRKWILRGKNTVWTGSGLSTDWHDTANWSPSAVPVDGQTAVLSNATVSISGEWSAPNLLMLGGNQVQFTGDCGVAVAEGKKLTLPECTVFNEGTTLTKYGLGTLAAGCDSTVDGVSLNFVNGVFDLNGTTQRFASVTGIHGTVTNSAETAGTLIVDTGAADGEAKLTARVAGNAAVVRTGAGALAVGGMLDNTQGVALSGGATTATAAELPAIAGCVLHLDAKRFDSFDTNENGCVTCWRSLTNPDYRFDAPSTYEPRLPRYDPTAFDGLGGVSFGKDPVGGTNAMSYLAFNHTSESLSIRTHFFVFRQRKNVLLGAVFGAVWGDSFIFRNIHGNSDSTSSWGTLNCDGGDAWVNGECIYDAFGAPSVIYTNELLIANSTNKTYGASRTGCLGLMHYYDDPKIGATELTAVRRKNSSYDWKLNYAPAIGATVQYTRYLDGWVGEIIFYDRILTDAEFRRVQKYLIDKWHVTPRSTVPNGGALHSGAELTLAAGAALDLGLGAFTQTVAKVTALGDAAVTNGALAISEALETRAGQGGEIPLLRLEGGIDLTGVDFTLSGATAESMGAVLQTDGAVTGPFRSVEARDPAAVRYRRHSVSYGVPGLLLFLR